jgi:hypothetical protein
MKTALPILFLMLAGICAAQTTTTYNLSNTTCNANPQHCTYYPAEANGGRFQTGDPWTQFVSGDNQTADYCFDFKAWQSTSVWTVTDDPALGATGKKFVLDCATSGLNREPSGAFHAEIFAYSYVVTYVCGGGKGSRGTCHATRWAVADGSFLEITKP